MRPEFPFLASGAIALTGGAIAEKQWPAKWASVVIGTVILVLVASATNESKVAPLVRAIGLLLVLTSTMAAVKRVNESKKVKK